MWRVWTSRYNPGYARALSFWKLGSYGVGRRNRVVRCGSEAAAWELKVVILYTALRHVRVGMYGCIWMFNELLVDVNSNSRKISRHRSSIFERTLVSSSYNYPTVQYPF